MSDAWGGAGVVAGMHDVVWVRGPDTVAFLDGLLSQDVAGMETGSVAHSLLLAPNGKLRAQLVLWRGEDEVGLVTPSGSGPTVLGDLSRFKIRVDVQLVEETRPVLTVIGDETAHVLEAAGMASPQVGRWAAGDTVVGEVPFVRGGPSRFVVIGSDADELVAGGAAVMPAEAVDALRIERGEPVVGRDVGDSTIPQELGPVDHAVSFTKGCYLGQELVARIDSRGHVNRHLRGVVTGRDVAPPAGAQLLAGDAVVGELTSFASSARLGAGVGLALVRREVQPGDEIAVQWDGGATTGVVHDLPLW